jgi:hypothetical protein
VKNEKNSRHWRYWSNRVGILTPALREKYGADNVIAVGHKREPAKEITKSGPYCQLDIRDLAALQASVATQQIKIISHLASFHGREAAMVMSAAYATVMGVLPLFNREVEKL